MILCLLLNSIIFLFFITLEGQLRLLLLYIKEQVIINHARSLVEISFQWLLHSLDFGLGEVETLLFVIDFQTGRMLGWKGLTMRQLVVSHVYNLQLLFELQLSNEIICLCVIVAEYLGSVAIVLDGVELAEQPLAKHALSIRLRAWSSCCAFLHVVAETVLKL